MPLNKYAGWGVVPLAAPRQPGLGAVTRDGFKNLNLLLSRQLPPAPAPGPGSVPVPAPAPTPPATPVPAVPSSAGLRVVWSLGALRDALTDQHAASPESTNAQIDKHLNSAAVAEVSEFLKQHYPALHEPYLLQFRPLDSDVQGYDLERRMRLAELAGVELEVMATVEDLMPVPPAPAAARRARRTR